MKIKLIKPARVFAQPGEIEVSETEARRLFAMGAATKPAPKVEAKPVRKTRKKKEETAEEE